jgi:Holliday junction DNA helicase RuvA
MIVRIEGEIVEVEAPCVHLRVGPMVYALYVPAFDLQSLHGRVGSTAVFETFHYFEAQGQGTTLLPRLIGFSSSADRAFFELFTTVKGIGNRKALRAMALPTRTIASAIASRDLDTLKTLPEIGRRTAETIVAELHEKMEPFLAGGAALPTGEVKEVTRSGLAHDALAVLIRLGEPRHLAVQWIDRALTLEPEIADAQTLVTAAFRIKTG